MFSLIITIISIALVAALALATLYFGGSSFMDGKPEAEAARYINEGSQIVGAVRLFQAEKQGALPGDLEDDLVGYYLKDMPKTGVDWDIASNSLVKPVEQADVCERVNEKAGWDNPNWEADSNSAGQHEPVSCDDASLEGETYYCCTVATAS